MDAYDMLEGGIDHCFGHFAARYGFQAAQAGNVRDQVHGADTDPFAGTLVFSARTQHAGANDMDRLEGKLLYVPLQLSLHAGVEYL